MAEPWITKASKKSCCPIRIVCIVRPIVYTNHYPEYFSLCSMTANILRKICTFSFDISSTLDNKRKGFQNIFDHFPLLFSKRYRLTASDRISSLIPIQIPSRIGPVSRIHNPLVFVFFQQRIFFVCYRIVEVSHCAKDLLRIYWSIA